MHDVTLRGPDYTFPCYGVHEAKQLGLIDSWEKKGTYVPVSTVFEQGEGLLLREFLSGCPDAICIASGRYQITVYRPARKVLEVPDDDAKDSLPRAKARKRFAKREGVAGAVACEGADGIHGYDSFEDVREACERKLAESGEPLDRSNDWLFANAGVEEAD